MPLADIGFAAAFLSRRYAEGMRGRGGASTRQVFPKSSLHQGGKARLHFLPAGERLQRRFQVSPNGDGCALHVAILSPIGEIGDIGETRFKAA
jgi:hypothetical protein